MSAVNRMCRRRRRRLSMSIGAGLLALASGLFVQRAEALDPAPSGVPDASVDLASDAGLSQVGGTWRYHDARPIEVDFRSVGPDRKPTGSANRTWDIEPKAGAADYDDSQWEVIGATTLDARRSTGKVSFAWYRTKVTIPEQIGAFATSGVTAVFSVVVDDYAEVWVDGKLPRELGQMGGSLAAGWNAPNRVVLGRNVKPGQTFHIAVFGINGPISDAPSNYIWVRSAKLELYQGARATLPVEVPFRIENVDPALTEILPAGTRVERLAENLWFGEGPVWSGDRLLFSDPNANRIYSWSEGELQTYRERSGYQGDDVARFRQPGSNGLTFDREGRLTICEHGNRRVTRLERDGRLTVVADRYQGKRLNSPNDLVYRSDGTLYFSDPPFGLPKFHDDPEREQPHFGVYSVQRGQVRLVVKDLRGPNGLAFSPDEKYLYVGNWDEKRKVVMRYPVNADGSLGTGLVFFDLTQAPGEEAIDGVKVDERGNVYVSGPGGLWIVSPAGKVLGTLVLPELPANFAWGGSDGRTLYLTARSGLYRIRLAVAGVRPEVVAGRP